MIYLSAVEGGAARRNAPGFTWGLALLCIGSGLGLCYFIGYRELRLALASSTTPEVLTLQQLIERGAEGNPYVEVRDFCLLATPGEYLVVVSSRQRWRGVYVPAVPTTGPASAKVQVLIYSTHVHDLQGVQELGQRWALVGLVVNEIQQTPFEARKRLAQMYPETDFSTCVVVEEGKTPPTVGRSLAGWGGGFGFCLVGAAALWRLWRPTPD